MYKIKRLVDKLYSTGGRCPRFTKNGKVWSTLPGLKNHLNMFISPWWDQIDNKYENCIVVEYGVEGYKEDVFDIGKYMEEWLKNKRKERGYTK